MESGNVLKVVRSTATDLHAVLGVIMGSALGQRLLGPAFQVVMRQFFYNIFTHCDFFEIA